MAVSRLLLCVLLVGLVAAQGKGKGKGADAAAGAAAAGVSIAKHADLPKSFADGKGPLDVGVKVIIKSVFKLAENLEQVGLQVMIKMKWQDKRFNGPTEGVQVPVDSVFNPNLQFLNAVKSELRREKVMIYPNNTVIKVKRMFLTLRQHMNYKWFPFDDHVWFLQMNSFDYTNDQLKFDGGLNVTIDKDLHASVFAFDKNGVGIYEKDYSPPIYQGQTYSTVTVLLAAHRDPNYFVSASVVPCCALMILASLNFWISAAVAPARVTIGAITIVSTLILRIKVDGMVPKVAYSTWIGYVVLFTFLFAVGGLGLYIIVHQRVLNKKTVDPKNDVVDVWARRLFGGSYVTLLVIMFMLVFTIPHKALTQLSEQMHGAPVGGMLGGIMGF